ncbi:MAG: tRNA pseudouridine(55) synthase TruB [Mycoplasma sp.]|nr:tRNA pseudouridine(55) synthase TruB [Mycoplasma sp.]
MFLLLDKKKGISSFKTINQYAKDNNIKKIGHTGTLDPLATGLLLVATNEDTKLIDYIDKGTKKYVATMKLGFISDTYDIDGEIQKFSKNIPSPEIIKKILLSMEGEQYQKPPQFSAKKVNGKRAYKLARKGLKVELKKIKVKLSNIKIISIINEFVKFEVIVSRGTYIRSIIHNFGKIAKCGAIMTELRRTSIGSLTEKQIGIIDISPLLTLPTINLVKEQINSLIKGNIIKNNTNVKGKNIIKVNGVICGIGYFSETIKTIKIFGNKVDTI